MCLCGRLASLHSKLISYYEDEVDIVAPTFKGLPHLEKAYSSLEEGIYQGCDLEECYLVTGESVS